MHLQECVPHVLGNGLSKAREAPAGWISVYVVWKVLNLMQAFPQEVAGQPVLGYS